VLLIYHYDLELWKYVVTLSVFTPVVLVVAPSTEAMIISGVSYTSDEESRTEGVFKAVIVVLTCRNTGALGE
jgi:hypothetical protein